MAAWVRGDVKQSLDTDAKTQPELTSESNIDSKETVKRKTPWESVEFENQQGLTAAQLREAFAKHCDEYDGEINEESLTIPTVQGQVHYAVPNPGQVPVFRVNIKFPTEFKYMPDEIKLDETDPNHICSIVVEHLADTEDGLLGFDRTYINIHVADNGKIECEFLDMEFSPNDEIGQRFKADLTKFIEKVLAQTFDDSKKSSGNS